MRELTVYYCPECGFYGYYQLSKNAVCRHCELSMTELQMTFQNFMRLEYHSRDKMIADQIAGEVTPYCSVVQRITEAENSCSARAEALSEKYKALEEEKLEQEKLIERLLSENRDLIRKNQESESTIRWMHDMIWDLSSTLRSKEQS